MKRALRALALAVPFCLAAVAACTSDEVASDAATFGVNVVIEGNGRVVGEPAGIACDGPRDCGTSTYAAGAAVTLTATPAGGYTLARISVNGAETRDRVLRGAAGTTERVVVTFVPGVGGPGPDDRGVGDAGVTSRDGGDGGDGGESCTATEGCGAGTICCLRGYDPTPKLLGAQQACETPSACAARDGQGRYGNVLCTGTSDPRCLGGTACTAVSGQSFRMCVGGD